MSVDVGVALAEGLDRMRTIPGIVVSGLFVLVGLLELPLHQRLSGYVWERVLAIEEVRAAVGARTGNGLLPETPMALPVSIEATLGGLVVGLLVVTVLRVIAIRAFGSSVRHSFPSADAYGSLWRATAAVIVVDVALVTLAVAAFLTPAAAAWYGGPVVALLALAAYLVVALGALAGAILLFFVRQAIALEGAGPIAAVSDSYGRCKANAVSIFALLVIVFVLGLVGGLGIDILVPHERAGPIAGTVYQRLVAVFGIAVATQAYQQTQ